LERRPLQSSADDLRASALRAETDRDRAARLDWADLSLQRQRGHRFETDRLSASCSRRRIAQNVRGDGRQSGGKDDASSKDSEFKPRAAPPNSREDASGRQAEARIDFDLAQLIADSQRRADRPRGVVFVGVLGETEDDDESHTLLVCHQLVDFAFKARDHTLNDLRRALECETVVGPDTAYLNESHRGAATLVAP